LQLALTTCLLFPQGKRHNPPGLALLRWAYKQLHESAYKGVCDMDLIPKLDWSTTALDSTLVTWTGEYTMAPDSTLVTLTRVDRSGGLTSAMALTSPVSRWVEYLLDGIPTERERLLMNPSALPSYADELVEYIHRPDNLINVCRHLMRPLFLDYGDFADTLLVRLIAIKPSHSAWAVCLTRLQREYEEDEVRQMFNRDRLASDVLAIQEILNMNIQDSSLVLQLDSHSPKMYAYNMDFLGTGERTSPRLHRVRSMHFASLL